MAFNSVSYLAVATPSTSRTGDFPSTATVAADVATLVADGVTPTQGHVNTLNTDWGTYLTAENLKRAGVVNIEYDTTLTINQIREAIRSLLFKIEGTF